jgi:riboflavin synthase
VFTGIVEALGTVRGCGDGGLEIEAVDLLTGAQLGDSVCINGVCLTITTLTAGRFRVDTVPETLRRTNLESLSAGDSVNLERAIPAGGRMGGHFVQGHVEGTARLTAIEPDGEARILRFAVAPELMRYVVEKGFIAVDGISLTVVSRDPDSFTVTLIPYTREHTTLGSRRIGDHVNLETDVLAKYVERLLHPAG